MSLNAYQTAIIGDKTYLCKVAKFPTVQWIIPISLLFNGLFQIFSHL